MKSIKDVMAHINEDKRKTECQLAMFDIFNDIDGCPVSYLYINCIDIFSLDYFIIFDIFSVVNMVYEYDFKVELYLREVRLILVLETSLMNSRRSRKG